MEISPIKYEGIKLQTCLIACKKGINVVVRFQSSEFSRLENSTFHRQLKTHKKWTPSTLYIVNALKVFFEEDEAEEATEKKIKNQKKI